MSWVQKCDQEWKREPGFPRATYGYHSTWHPPKKVQNDLPLGTPSSEFRHELYPGVTLLPIYTFPALHQQAHLSEATFSDITLSQHPFAFQTIVPMGLPFSGTQLHFQQEVSPTHPDSSLHCYFVGPNSLHLTTASSHCSCSSLCGWSNHTRPRSMVPRSFAVVAPVGL